MASSSTTHPLSPLSEQEQKLVVELVKSQTFVKHELNKQGRCKFISISVEEPDKHALLSKEGNAFIFDDAQHFSTIDRLSRVILLDVGQSKNTTFYYSRTFEVVINLTKRCEQTFIEHHDVEPALRMEEFLAAEKLVCENKPFQEAMKKRGFTNPSRWMVEPWSAGYFGHQQERGKRLIRAFVWVRVGSDIDNGYAHPVDGLQPVVDVNNGSVEIVQDGPDSPTPVPHECHNFSRSFVGPSRTSIKPIVIEQPQGTSFKVINGSEVHWQGWKFVVGFNQREGLTLHCLSFGRENGTSRAICYRMALSEMVVPYFSARGSHYRKNAFDVGEYGLGNLVNPLQLGCDCLGEIYYFTTFNTSASGNVVEQKNSICMHEEDDGVLFKHTDWRLEQKGHADAVTIARSTKLVVSMICTVGNYEYAIYYNFYQDGNIKPEIKATGLLNTSAIKPNEKPICGQLLGKGLEAQHHQHAFSFRFDMCVDGPNNSVVEIDSIPINDKAHNPYGNAIEVKHSKFKREHDAQRCVNFERARFWAIVNEQRKNSLGDPTAYALFPGPTAWCYLQDHSHVLKRARFLSKHLWVTKFQQGELFAAGAFPNQSNGQHHTGLGGDYTKNNRSIENTDIVVWHTEIMHHVVRPEDFPLMPVARVEFWLKPVGFFDSNPCPDVPQKAGCSSQKGDCSVRSKL